MSQTPRVPTPPEDTHGLQTKSLPPLPLLNRVIRDGYAVVPSRPDDLRLVSNGETFGIQRRYWFLWVFPWWSTEHAGLSLEHAKQHIAKVRSEIADMRRKKTERWYPVDERGTYPPIPNPLPPPPAPPPWRDTGRRKGKA